jgi:adenosylcobinamide-GDP ribazoletransferase
MLKSLSNVLGFLSIFPTGMPDSIEDVAENMYLFPLVGAFIGLLTALFYGAITSLLPISISSALSFFFLLSLTGLHHMDGLVDFGDALLYRGSREDRIRVLRDTSIGVGGFSAGLFGVILGVLTTYEFLITGGMAFAFFIVSESLAKFSLIVAAFFGRAEVKGTGSVFVNKMHGNRAQFILGLVITIALIWTLMGLKTPILLILPVLTALLFVHASNKLIGGMSGDFFGALNEATRVFVMLVMVWML